jgi:hypothetical protein
VSLHREARPSSDSSMGWRRGWPFWIVRADSSVVNSARENGDPRGLETAHGEPASSGSEARWGRRVAAYGVRPRRLDVTRALPASG